MKQKGATYIVKLVAKIASSLMAAFILFIFLGEAIGESNKPKPPKGVIQPIKVGQSFTATDSLLDGKWLSSNTSIAIVDSVSGTITGIKTGSVSITHTANTGTKIYSVDIAPSTLHDAIMLSILAFVWIGLVLMWWKEEFGAWLNIITITAQIILLYIMNHLSLTQPIEFWIGAVPGVVILICRVIEQKKEQS
jgi:hypothetical protein